MSGLTTIEERAAAQLSASGHGLSPAEIDQILDLTVTYVEAGIARTSAVQVVRLDQ